MAEVQHHIVMFNGTRMHVAELGNGPLVLFVHGFPESWYSWRNQLTAVADHGYRAAAISVRGYGRSSKPTAIEAYRMLCHVADNVGVVRALRAETAIIVGHDWGAPIAWTSAQLRPDVFTAVVGMSVPFAPSGPNPPTSAFGSMGGDDTFYIEYFQEPGRAESEIETDIRSWLLGTYYSSSGEGAAEYLRTGAPTSSTIAPGGTMRDRFLFPDAMPGWLSDADLDHYCEDFERTGFRGPLNRYRNVDRDWEDLAAFSDVPIHVPSLFLAGEHDPPIVWGAPNIERFERTLPGLVGFELLPGCGHWVQQEQPEAVNSLLLSFLDRVVVDR